MLCGLLAAGPALAESVPLPTPAPRPKTGTAPPPPSAAPENKPGLFGSSRQSNGLFQFPFFGGSKTDTGKTGTTAATAFDAKQRALADKVSAYLSSVQTLVGNFVQVGPDGGRTEGTFYIQKPGKVRFEYNAPSPIDIVADGSSVIVRDRKLATQDLYPLSQTPLRYLLADRIDLLRDTDVVSITADDTFITVVVEEKTVVIGTSRLTMMFDAKERAAQAMDGDRSAGLRHHRRGLQSRHGQEARSQHVRDQLPAQYSVAPFSSAATSVVMLLSLSCPAKAGIQ